MTLLRWLHLSDFHTGKDDYGQRRLFHYVLKHVKDRVESGLAPDFVFITGDVANKGKDTEYRDFNENLLLPLIDLLPHDVQSRIYLIPGNHDVDRSKARAVQTYDLLVKIPEFLDPDEPGLFERSQAILPRFQSYARNDLTSNREHWLFSREGVYCDIQTLDRKKIGILGLNTAWLSYSDHDRHRLSPGKPLLEDGLEKIWDCDLKFVLGHHPLDWFLDEELESIRALLGRYNVVYLHGHMHKNRSRHEEGAGYPFLSLQSGASFQAREDEMWVNRFLWCEMDPDARRISAEPLQWSRDHQGWVLDPQAFPEIYRREDRWVLSLPSLTKTEPKPIVGKTAKVNISDLPKGWVMVDAKYLKNLGKELSPEQALSFFDGRTPIWREALAPQIPRREIVSKLVQELEAARASGGVQVTLLVGAAGEGKTTALLQTACDLVNRSNDWHVLWHDDSTTPLPAKFIARLPESGSWLVISDDAEIIARRVFEATQSLTSRRDVQFLLCCRDTDWKSVGADRFAWKGHNINFVEVPLRGLTSLDAEQVLSAWSRYGRDGLKELNDMEFHIGVNRLVDAARSSRADHEGSFFGAILQVRYGDGLKDHIRSLLQKLASRRINERTTLKDAFAYIAAIHVEDLQILSREVLAGTLGMDPKDMSNLNRVVLRPLGEEAAIATTGHFIFTRHPAIARVAIEVLKEGFDLEIDDLYVDLVKSAREVANTGVYVTSRGSWDFLSMHFFNKEQYELSIRLGQAALEVPGNESFLIPKLAHLYREAGWPEQAVTIFHSIPYKIEANERPFYYEWSIAEAKAGRLTVGAWLAGYSLSDEVVRSMPSLEDGKMALLGLSIDFYELYRKFNQDIYIEACGAAAQLGLVIEKSGSGASKFIRNQGYANESGVDTVSPEIAVQRLRAGIAYAYEQREAELPKWINAGNALHFRGLAGLLRIPNPL